VTLLSPVSIACCVGRPGQQRSIVSACAAAALPAASTLGARNRHQKPATSRAAHARLPPLSPPSGPRSMIQSAVLMTSRLCSITTTCCRYRPARAAPRAACDVLEMQAGGRLVEDVERAAGGAARQLLRQLDALRLAARERRRLLADMDVAEPDALQGLELVADRRHGLEELRALVDRHVEHVGDRLARNSTRASRGCSACPGRRRTDVDVGQEVHLDLDDAVALAGLAAPALDVEREAARLVAARLRLGQPREPVADRREAPV
jgi:hypothetical protein